MATNRVFSVEDRSLEKSSVVSATKNRDYEDIDMSLSVRPVTGDIYTKKNAKSVIQAIQNLLLTNRTEKPYSPYYGANLNNFLFELAEIGLEEDITNTIIENIRVFEPRVDYRTVEVDVDMKPDSNSIDLTIKFTIINTSEDVSFTTRLSRLR
jgi:phage baseplate assembly protein W